jgi:hypothetical protein
MTDAREAVLVRLVTIAGAVEGVVLAARNKLRPADTQRPAIVVLDADEEVPEGVASHVPAEAAQLVRMTPEIYIILGGSPDTVGTDINTLRARLIKAILTDTTLKSILGIDRRSNGRMRYLGCATGLALDRSLMGEMGVSFAFTYVLNPADL